MECLLSQSLPLLAIVIIVLQVVTIFLISGKKKQARDAKNFKRPAGVPSGENKAERKDADPRRAVNGSAGSRKPVENRNNKPPQQQQARSPQNQSVAIDPMEKSLRDINLRLKNAEREQESARKRIQDNGNGPNDSRDGRPQEGRPQDGRPQDGRFQDGRPQQRDHRGHGPQGGRSDRPPRRERGEFNREAPPRREHRPERPERPERPNREEPENAPRAGYGFQENSQFEDRPRRPEHADQPAAPQAPDMAPANFGASEDHFQHGRKFTAKRRQLPENVDNGEETENTQNAPAPDMDTPVVTAAPENVQVFTPEPDVDVQVQVQGDDGQSETAEIQFGRGRR